MIRTLVLTTFVLSILTLISCKNAVERNDISIISTENEALIDTWFKDFQGDRPGATVMIAKGKELLFCKSYGLANLEEKTLTTCETNYRIGSVSKQFTAMAILKLMEQGKLTQETSLTEIFPDFPAYGKDMTIFHLLTHQSGLKDYGELADKAGETQLSDADVLEYLKTLKETAYVPGGRFQYSNSAFAVLATVVSKVSKMPFEEFMKQEIFAAANMNRTQYPTEKSAIVNRALGYAVIGESIEENDQSTGSAIKGDGSIYTSADDYFQWHLALNEEKVVKPNLHQAAYLPQAGTRNCYGFGWFMGKDSTTNFVEHGGSTAGFVTYIARIPAEKITVAIFTNRGYSYTNIASQNLAIRAKGLLSIATDGKVVMPPADGFDKRKTPPQSLAESVYKMIKKEGIEAAVAHFENVKYTDDYVLREEEMNAQGYQLLQDQNPAAALAVFQLNVNEFPKSWNVYDSLGETYMAVGNDELAIVHYKKSLELNPENNFGIEALKKLGVGE